MDNWIYIIQFCIFVCKGVIKSPLPCYYCFYGSIEIVQSQIYVTTVGGDACRLQLDASKEKHRDSIII